jgi:hypothetical protein
MQQNMRTSETLTQGESAPEYVNGTYRLPVDIHEALREKAFRERSSQAQIVLDALRAHLRLPSRELTAA